MNRAERRRQMKAQKRGEARYNVSKDQLRKLTDEVAAEKIAEARDEAMRDAMVLMLTLPLLILRDHYWKKSFRQKAEGFTNKVLELYGRFQDGEVTMDELRQDLWEYGGVRFERGEDS